LIATPRIGRAALGRATSYDRAVRRASLNNFAAGIASSFVSRNNDYDGYWALGQLRSLSEQLSRSKFCIPLVPRVATHTLLLDAVASHYAVMLTRWFEAAGAHGDSIVEARIRVSFAIEVSALLPLFRSACGKPFACEVELLAASGKSTSAREVGYCWAHDPARETRRAPGHRVVPPSTQDVEPDI
jgi:hypothetical protein